MRVMVTVMATPETEAETYSNEEMTKMFEEMGKYNEQLINAGIMLSGEGLQPTSRAKAIKFSGANRTVVDGPFAEAKEIVAGFWLWQVKDMNEAVEWALRCPNPTGREGELQIRPIGELEDFGDAVTPEVLEQDQRLRNQMGSQQA